MKDSRWIIIFVILLSVIVTASIMNHTNNTETSPYIENTIDIDNGDQDINWNNYPYTNIQLQSSIELKESGTYHLSGTMLDGEVTVNPSANAFIKIILDNVVINNSTGPAISCHSGDDLVIELVGENTLRDGTTYLDTYDEDVTGAIYSKADLTFQGDGKLAITSNYGDGIISKDDLTFRSGTYNITSQDDGIRGKDSVHVVGGYININSTADAIKTTNDIDPTKGFVLIESGNININSGAKGIKATKYLFINDGVFSIASSDDSIHSDNYVNIQDGRMSIDSGDDGIHANRELTINGGTISILKSYEGLEAQKVTINDGEISILSFDDGINAGGGTDQSAIMRANKSPFNTDENCELTIAGGDIYVDSSGDGLDSNGWLNLNGGRVVIDGPADDGNSALDSGMGIMMNGAEVLALGYSGMAEDPNQTSKTNSLSAKLDSVYPKDTEITIMDSSDNTVMSHISAKPFTQITTSSPTFTIGDKYKLYLNDQLYNEFTISGVVTNLGNNYQNRMQPKR